MMKRMYFILSVIMVFMLTSTKIVYSQNVKTTNDNQTQKIKVLLITDHNFGSSFVYDDPNIQSIKKQFEVFGWNLTLAAFNDTVNPCEWGEQTLGTKPMATTCNIAELKNPAEFDAIVILPGNSFVNLTENVEFLNFLKLANQQDVVIAAWCRGVSLLAAADIVRNKKIIGHFDYFDKYKAAGADYIEYTFKLEDGKKIFNNASPPIRDKNIITTIRSLYYRNEMCALIKEAIEENQGLGDIYFLKRFPNLPIFLIYSDNFSLKNPTVLSHASFAASG